MHMDIEARVRRAEELFREGYNCSQSVLLAFADLTGADEALLGKLSIGLGGGVGRLREVCGAVSGMAMVAGFICDRDLCGEDGAGGPSVELRGEGSGAGESFVEPGGEGAVSAKSEAGGSGEVRSAGDGVTGGGAGEGAGAGARRAEQKKLAYSLVQELAAKFREENGSIVCHELLDLRVSAAKAGHLADGAKAAEEGKGGLADTSAYSPVPQERNEAYYKARPCQKLVGCSARIIAEYIAKNY